MRPDKIWRSRNAWVGASTGPAYASSWLFRPRSGSIVEFALLDLLPTSLRKSVASSSADTQPEGIIRLLNGHGVRYIVIGGLAAVTHGSPTVTDDIDLCYARK